MKAIYQMAAEFRTAILKAKANREFSGDGLIERFPGGNCGIACDLLHELKEKIDAVVEKKLPSFKALMEMKPMAVAQTTVKDASLTVYQNGYAVYEMDGAHTVMAVDHCGDYRYDFTDGTYQVVPAETFEETEWSVRLLMEGERRMEHNRNNRTAETENVSLECDGSDWSAAVMVDFLDEDNAEMLADRELRRLYEFIKNHIT